MSDKILDIIASETNGKSYKTYKYCFDSTETSPIDYDDNKQITWKKYGETVPPKSAKNERGGRLVDVRSSIVFLFFRWVKAYIQG